MIKVWRKWRFGFWLPLRQRAHQCGVCLVYFHPQSKNFYVQASADPRDATTTQSRWDNGQMARTGVETDLDLVMRVCSVWTPCSMKHVRLSTLQHRTVCVRTALCLELRWASCPEARDPTWCCFGSCCHRRVQRSTVIAWLGGPGLHLPVVCDNRMMFYRIVRCRRASVPVSSPGVTFVPAAGN